MKSILIVGCGDIGLRIIPLLNKGYRVFALIRNPEKAMSIRQLGAIPIVADLDRRSSLARLKGLADYILHLAPPASQGSTDVRTQNLLAALSAGRLPSKLVYISTSGVYGDCLGAKINETHPIKPYTARALRRVAAEKMVRHWGRRLAVPVSILRVPGIYAAERLPLARLSQGLPCVVNEEDSYTNHIHADDLARICLAALRFGRAGRIYHACDNSQLKMGAYFDMVAEAFNLAKPPRVSRAEAATVLSPMLWSFMNESRRLVNQRMLEELSIKLLYPTVADCLNELKGNG